MFNNNFYILLNDRHIKKSNKGQEKRHVERRGEEG